MTFVSLVRSTKLGFVSDDRRLNAALTWAKRGLVVLGGRSLLREPTSLWRTWADWTAKEDLQSVESDVLPEGHDERWTIFYTDCGRIWPYLMAAACPVSGILVNRGGWRVPVGKLLLRCMPHPPK